MVAEQDNEAGLVLGLGCRVKYGPRLKKGDQLSQCFETLSWREHLLALNGVEADQAMPEDTNSLGGI